MLHVLLGRHGDVGLDAELVWQYYGEPDEWDPVEAWIPTTGPGGEGMRSVRGKCMFPYISPVYKCMLLFHPLVQDLTLIKLIQLFPRALADAKVG